MAFSNTSADSIFRAPDKFYNVYFLTKSLTLVKSSPRDDSNKWSNIGFGVEMTEVELIKVHFTHLIWSSVKTLKCFQRKRLDLT